MSPKEALQIMKLEKVDRVAYPILLAIMVIGLLIDLIEGEHRFEYNYVPEDGLIENFTAVFLFIGACLLIRQFVRNRSKKGITWIIGTLGIALVFIFGAGEEISWGQRIFGWETSEAMSEINKQGETNLHNIRIGDFDINKLIFSKLLTIGIIFYLLILPFLYDKFEWINKMVNKWGLPLPKWHHTIAFLIMTLLILPITSGKKWELYEFGFATVFCLIFLFPKNKSDIH